MESHLPHGWNGSFGISEQIHPDEETDEQKLVAKQATSTRRNFFRNFSPKDVMYV